MGDISEHNDSSILRDLSSEYESLCSQTKEQSEKIETLNQEVYALRNRIQIAERVQVEYQSEVDCLQQQLSESNVSHAELVCKLKEDHAKVVKDLEDQINCFQSDLLDAQEKSNVEKEELIKVRKELQHCQDTSSVAALKAELQEVLEDLAANRVACIQHQDLNKVLLKEKADLNEELSRTREHLETVEEKMKIYKTDLAEQGETLEELRESLAVAQSELSCLKAAPADTASRGNSLFAEVEDKRQAMKKMCSSLSGKYNDMKKDYGAKCAEISRLKLEIRRLHRKWIEEAEERDNRDVWLKDNYEIRIKELLQMVECLKREERPVFVNGDFKILTYAEQEVEKSRKEMATLREEMETRSSERLNEAKALYLARGQVLSLKGEVMKLRAENLILRSKLEEADITDIPSPGKTVQQLREIFQSRNEDLEVQSSKINSEGIIEESVPSQEVSERKTEVISLPAVSSSSSEIPKPKRLIMLETLEMCAAENPTEYTNTMQTKQDQPILLTECLLSDEAECPKEDILSSTAEMDHIDSAHCTTIKSISEIETKEDEETQSLQNDNLTISQPSQVDKSEARQSIVLSSSSSPQSICPGTSSGSDQEESNENGVDAKQEICPTRSILSKLPRPLLVPIDQNAMMRKVRFAVEEKSSLPSTAVHVETDQTHSPKKKLVKMSQPKSYKTKFVVSQESKYQ